MGDEALPVRFGRRWVRGVVFGRLLLALALWVSNADGVGAESRAVDESRPPNYPPNKESEDVLAVPGTVPSRGTRSGGTGPVLDDLLRLPSGFEAKPAARPVAGASEDEWKSRFSRAEKAIGDAREALTATKRELDSLAESGGASQWSVAPPGASGGGQQQSTSPLSFKLRQELLRNRQALEEAERARRELRIEADLAGVPANWRVIASNPSGSNVPPTPN